MGKKNKKPLFTLENVKGMEILGEGKYYICSEFVKHIAERNVKSGWITDIARYITTGDDTPEYRRKKKNEKA